MKLKPAFLMGLVLLPVLAFSAPAVTTEEILLRRLVSASTSALANSNTVESAKLKDSGLKTASRNAGAGTVKGQAYLLDTGGLGDVGELYLLGALQGIVNRDAPRLFLTKGAANTVYADYLEREKGFTFIRLKASLRCQAQ